MDATQICKRLETLKTLRMPHEQVWRDCFDHSFVMRGSGLQMSPLDAQQGLDRKARIVDSTATDAGRILASALQSGMTPANARWFGLEVANADEESERWLDDKADQLHQEIHNANFDAVGFESQLDMVGAGWFAMFITEGVNGGLVFESWPIAQCYATASRAGGPIDGIYREYTLTVTQAIQFAKERGGTVSGTTQAKELNEPDTVVQMVHCIQPRAVYAVGARMGKNMRFESCHVEKQTRHTVLESGYPEFPVVVPRWSLIPGSSYAIGPMFDALPDVRELNELKRMDKAAADIAIAGMWIATDDGVLNPRTVKVGPRKIIVANDVDSMKPLMTGSNWQLADVRIAQLQAAIRKVLMADQLQPQDGPAMTATEIHARVALLRQQLGPLFGRMQAEYLQGLIERCFMLAFRAGIFGLPPQALANRSFSIKYISPLARAQKLEDVSAIQQLNEQLTIVAVNMGKQDVLDNVDFDEQANAISEALGVPMKTMRTADQVKALRDARAQQQQAAQQAQQQQATQAMAAEQAMKSAGARAAA